MKGKIRNDIKLIGVFLSVSLFLAAVIHFFVSDRGAVVRVLVDGQIAGEYSLYEERTVMIRGVAGFDNTLVIKEGRADITDAGCPDQLCVRQKAVSRTGESMICLPNRVVVEIAGAEGNEVDAVAD